MAAIGATLYSFFTIIFIAVIIVYAYMYFQNDKYKIQGEIYKMDNSNHIVYLFVGLAIYSLSITLSIENIGKIMSNPAFQLCMIASIVVSFIICKGLDVRNKTKLDYAKLLLADEEILDKIIAAKNQIKECQIQKSQYLKSDPSYKVFESTIHEINQIVNELSLIHAELQSQKILYNAEVSKTMNNVKFKDKEKTMSDLRYENDKIKSFKELNNPNSNIASLMKKYNL